MKKKRLIKQHLESMKRAKEKLPEKYHPIEDVTKIHYGFMGRKTITVEDIKNYKKSLILTNMGIEMEKLSEEIWSDIFKNEPI